MKSSLAHHLKRYERVHVVSHAKGRGKRYFLKHHATIMQHIDNSASCDKIYNHLNEQQKHELCHTLFQALFYFSQILFLDISHFITH